MKCYFCHSYDPNSSWHGYMCLQCPRQVCNTSYTMSGICQLVYMYVDQYTIGLDIKEQSCFILHKDTQQYLLTMNYIPNVNPYNVEQYVKKLLKLKVFL